MRRWLLLVLGVWIGAASCEDKKSVVGGGDDSGAVTGFETVAVLFDTLQFAMNFRDNQLPAADAIRLYRSCLADGADSCLYSYDVYDPIDPVRVTESYLIEEEMACIESLFTNVEYRGLYLTAVLRERTIDTSATGVLCQYGCRVEMQNPMPGAFPYLVQGEWVFDVVQLANGRYCIKTWMDFTNPSVAARGTRVLVQNGWSEIKYLFR